HDIVTVAETGADEEDSLADIVGPICESGDYLARGRRLGKISDGDLIVLKSAGAYGAVMSSNYNSRPLVPEVLVDGDSYKVVRRRQTLDEMLALEE
ncbi:MAG: diaminopimelate decarboxylase, partial [Nisaea sp.]